MRKSCTVEPIRVSKLKFIASIDHRNLTKFGNLQLYLPYVTIQNHTIRRKWKMSLIYFRCPEVFSKKYFSKNFECFDLKNHLTVL